MRKMLKALASTLNALCKDGKLPVHSRNLLINSQFHNVAQGNADSVVGWRPFGNGFTLDPIGGRIGYGSEDAYALKMSNLDWRDSAGATQVTTLRTSETLGYMGT